MSVQNDDSHHTESSIPNRGTSDNPQPDKPEGQASHTNATPKTTPSPIKKFTMLENNPEIMTDLAHQLGASKSLRFHDIYSLSDLDVLSSIPRPVHALLVTIPMTEQWKLERDTEDARTQWYDGVGPGEAVMWFRQIIIDGCGLIGLLHCLLNGAPATLITPGSLLDDFKKKAALLRMDDRARLLNEDDTLFELSEAAAVRGDTPSMDDSERQEANHYVALVRGDDGRFWELEGSRKGPIDRGTLGPGEDALSERALDLGIRRLVRLAQGSEGGLRFSCIALASDTD